jgi:nucleoside-diphosphate-sugar epimerase
MKALVTGGGGFLGGAIVRLLRDRGVAVRSISRQRYPTLDAEQVQGDIADADAVRRAVEGCDIVFHVAAKAGISPRYREYHEANVIGTENIVSACRAASVSRLVYTSSPSVVFDGSDMENVDETVPYPKHYHAAYPKTKAQAERLVLAANDGQLATVALRPHLIWGPGDNHLVPRILARAKAGRLRLVGSGANKIDSIYIDNAALGHLQAADRLSIGSPISGRAYFLSNGEPMAARDLINGILAAAGQPPVTKSVSPRVAYLAGAFLETIYSICWPTSEPPMTRFLAKELATAHWFDLTAARRDLGYEPKVSIAEGLERLREWLMQGANSCKL